jgi:CheY-like chemotaxis protein
MSDRKRILMVDDDTVLCELTQEVLKETGYDVIAVSDVEEARAAFSDNHYKFDLILLDHGLSGVSGEEFAADFLRLRPDIPIALYTGAAVSLEEVRPKGIRAVIPRPLTKSELTAALEHILNGVL